MCGIVGFVGRAPAAAPILDALRRLEYRGYDSAGIATLERGLLTRRRAVGKLKNLDGKTLFGAVLKNPKASEKLNEVTSATLENVKVEGDTATGTVKTGNKSEPMRFVKEGGSWKITPPGAK